MLALRLHGSRSIRPNSRGSPSCPAHIVRASATGRGRPHALVRAYATVNSDRSNKLDDSNKIETLFAGKKNAAEPPEKKPRASKAASTATAPSKSPASASKRQPAAAKASDEAKTLQIVRESAQLLRDFQANPHKYAGDEAAADKLAPKLPNTAPGAPKYNAYQNQILQTTIKVLQDALTLHVNSTASQGGKRGSEDKAVTQSARDALANLPRTMTRSQAKATEKAPKSTAQEVPSQEKTSKAKEEPQVKAKEEPQVKAKEEPQVKAKEEPQVKAESRRSSKKKTESDTKETAQQKAESRKQSKKKVTPAAKEEAPEKAESEETSKKKVVPAAKEEAPGKAESGETSKKKVVPAAKEEAPEKAESGETSKKRKRDKAKQAPKQTEPDTQKKQMPPPEVSDAVSASLATVVANARAAKAQPKHKPDEGISSSRTGARKKLNLAENEFTEFKPQSSTRKRKHVKVTTFTAETTAALIPIEAKMPPVPLIQYGLDRVLFKEGVYPLQDPRTRVWNFDPYLGKIMPVSEFDFEALKEYTTSSKDQKLIGVTKDQGKKYTGSTSSMTSTLAHFHYLLSQWRPLNHARMTRSFEALDDPTAQGFSNILKAPAATFLTYKDGVYAIDADKEWDDETILSMLGHSMEKLLTVPKDEFDKYSRSKSHLLTDDQKGQDQAYHYSAYGDFMMRSQLDAYDPRLPGSGIFDVKTRAVVSVRADAANHQNGVGYEIRKVNGDWESYEREYFDLARSAFLKYSLQVRMGRMDGIFVAYHNTERIFGFQYIPTEEMDLVNHGTMDKTLGDMEFTASVKLLNDLLNQATAKFPEKSLRVWVETRTSESVPFLYFFAEPVTEEQIKEVQNKKEGAVDSFRERLGIVSKKSLNSEVEQVAEEALAVDEAEEACDSEQLEVKVPEEDSAEIWEDMMDVVEATMDKDAEGITAIRDAIQEALQQSGLLHAKSSDEAERYIEALLKSIVDPDANLAKTEDDTKSEAEASDESDVQPDTTAESVEPEPSIPKKSGLASLFSWFRSAPKEAEAPPQQTEAPAQDTAQEDSSPADGDNSPSPELVELLVKLTSRVGTAATHGKKSTAKTEQQQLSDDQAKIHSFETILAEMMPKAVENAEAEAAEADEQDASAVTPQGASEKESPKSDGPLFGMVVTVRNKVNHEDVERPTKLRRSDRWDIEYAMEEIKPDTAKTLHRQVKSRRRTALARSPKVGSGQFKSQRSRNIEKYTEAGRAFRSEESKITEVKPVWIVGYKEPFTASSIFTGIGPRWKTTLPSLTAERPNPEEYPGRIEYRHTLPRGVPFVSASEVEETTPTLEATEPTLEATKPTLEATKPTLEATKLTFEATKSTFEATEPILEATKPTLEATKPILETIKATLETTELSPETAKPTVETTKLTLEATNAANPTLEAAELTLKTAKPTLEATDPTMEAAEPTLEPTFTEQEQESITELNNREYLINRAPRIRRVEGKSPPSKEDKSAASNAQAETLKRRKAPKLPTQERERKVESIPPQSSGGVSSVSDAEAASLNAWLSQQSGGGQQTAEAASEDDNGKNDKASSIEHSVAELRKGQEKKASSFKEWRERSKQQ